MSAALIDRLARAGIHLALGDGESLRWSAPPGVMTPALAETLRARKPALVAALRAEARRDAHAERIAIAEHEGGLAPLAATLLALVEAMPPPEGAGSADWLAWRDALARNLDRERARREERRKVGLIQGLT